MRQSIRFAILCVTASHYFHLGICEDFQHLFIYPPDYVKADAPRNNESGAMHCKVKIHLEIWAINEISLQKQDLEVDLTVNILWVDRRLSVNPNISSQSLWPVMDKSEKMQIWTPTLLFRNCKGCAPISVTSDLSVEKTTGTIFAQTRLLHKFTCAIDLRAYPMDIQFCQIQLYACQDTEDAIKLQHAFPDNEVQMGSNLTLAEYRITPIFKTNCVYKDAVNYVYSCLELRIRLEHLVTYHLMTSYAPTSFIVILSWISFWLPLDLAPARVALGLTTLLTLATRLDQAQKNLPPVAYAKAIDVWMFYCIFMVSSSLCEFAISHYQHQLQKTTPKLQFRKIKVRPFPIKANKSTSSDQTASYTSLDRISRIIFPLAFLLFNLLYWGYYLTYYN